VSMAINMQKRMKDLRNTWIKDFGLEEPLSARIGISTGYCSVGNFGSASRLDYTVIGSAVNLAARLQTSCKEDGILLSKDTYWQVKEKFQCSNAGKIEVKGFSEAISTYEVLFDVVDDQSHIYLKTENLNLDLNLRSLTFDEIDALKELASTAHEKMLNMNPKN
nr:adenylate/guanylate cyclase domain-containing protein [Alphaproteobacteria bacterium]